MENIKNWFFHQLQHAGKTKKTEKLSVFFVNVSHFAGYYYVVAVGLVVL